jgi:hypothetical protein
MYKWFRKWLQQRALEKIIGQHHLCDMYLYDYKGGQYELLVEGPANDHTEAQVHTFVDEMLDGISPRKELVAIYRTYEGGGLLMGMRPNKSHIERHFLKNVFSMEAAFIDIAAWLKKAG